MGTATDDIEFETTNDGGTVDQALGGSGTPVVRIVTAVADELDVDPREMTPLYETLDTDALDRLLRTDASIEVVFEHDGHAIEVGSDGAVTVDGRQSPRAW
jgi:hypothetical protein